MQVARSNAEDYEAVVGALRCRILELERGVAVEAASGPSTDRSEVREAVPSLAGGLDRVSASMEACSVHDCGQCFRLQAMLQRLRQDIDQTREDRLALKARFGHCA